MGDCVLHKLAVVSMSYNTANISFSQLVGLVTVSYNPARLTPPHPLQSLISSEIRYDDCSSAALLT
jgi:hypothetical protein